MNWKIASAFLAGAFVASGIVYVAVKPAPEPEPAVMTTARPQAPPQIETPPLPSPAPAVEDHLPTAPQPTSATRPAREKPSPMPPPVRREKPAIVARNQEPSRVLTPHQPAPDLPAPSQAPPSQTAVPQPVEPQPAPQPAPQAVEPQPTAQQVNVQPEIPPSAPREPQGRAPNTVVLATGTNLWVRIGETISAARNQIGDSFFATLEQPLVIDGFIIAERGSRVEGRVVEAAAPGRTGGTSHLGIALVRLSTSDGQRIRIRTEPYKKDGSGGGSTGSDLARVGAGAAIGAAIGGIAGGGKGAAIGAGAGAAAGAGSVLITSGKPAEIPVETRLTFHVQEPVTITERLD